MRGQLSHFQKHCYITNVQFVAIKITCVALTVSALPMLTVGPWADVKNGFAWKIIIVLKVRGGHGE